MTDEILTQACLKELLHYDPETGVFTWKVQRSRVKAGTIAGHKNANGYIVIYVLNRPYKAHRLAWLYANGYFPPEDIDHINGAKADNRIQNLREASRKVNSRNQKIFCTNSSGIPGVYWSKRNQKWGVEVSRKYLGLYSCFFEACCARKSAERQYNFHPNHGRA